MWSSVLEEENMTHRFLAILFASDGWTLEKHGRLFRTRRLAKEWVEKSATKQNALCAAHQKKFNTQVRRVRNDATKLDLTLRRLQKEQPWSFETAEVHQLFQSGSLKLVADFSSISKTGKEGDEWVGWS